MKNPYRLFNFAPSVVTSNMHDYSLYSAILGLSSKWRITNVTVDEQSGELELHIRSRMGSRFSCSNCGALKLPTRIGKARWLHENHLNIRFYISALIPIITCERCGEMRVKTPWEHAATICEELEPVDSPGEDETEPQQLF